MTADKELVMYSRKSYCPYVNRAKRVLGQHRIAYREIPIDDDPVAEKRVVEWTGFKSVPTIIVARPGEDLPIEPPAPLEPGVSPRNIDRGSMITEPGEEELLKWLRRHGFVE